MKPCLWIAVLLALGPRVGAQTNSLPTFQIQTAREYLDQVGRALQAQAGTNSDTYLIRARTASRFGQTAAAERLVRSGLASGSRAAELHLLLAKLLIREDRMEEAAASLRQVVALQPTNAAACAQLGMVLDRLGDRTGAQDAFATGVRVGPSDSTVRLLLGRSLLDQGLTNEALVELDKACQLNPSEAGAWYALFQARTRLGQTAAADQALAKFQQLKRQEKTDMDAENAARDDAKDLRALAAAFHVEAAALLSRLGKETLAEEHLRAAMLIAPDQPAAYEFWGEVCLRNGRLPEARQAYEDLTRLRPERIAYGVNLGTVLLQLRDYPGAVRELHRVLELDPQQPAALHNLARLDLSTRRDLPEALLLSQRLVAVDPKAANYDLLGWALHANGRTKDAVQACAQAVAQDPTNTAYAEHYRRIQQAAEPSKP